MTLRRSFFLFLGVIMLYSHNVQAVNSCTIIELNEGGYRLLVNEPEKEIGVGMAWLKPEDKTNSSFQVNILSGNKSFKQFFGKYSELLLIPKLRRELCVVQFYDPKVGESKFSKIIYYSKEGKHLSFTRSKYLNGPVGYMKLLKKMELDALISQ